MRDTQRLSQHSHPHDHAVAKSPPKCCDGVGRSLDNPLVARSRAGSFAPPSGSKVTLLLEAKASPNAPTTAQLQVLRQSIAHFRLDTVARAGTVIQAERPDAVIESILAMLREITQA